MINLSGKFIGNVSSSERVADCFLYSFNVFLHMDNSWNFRLMKKLLLFFFFSLAALQLTAQRKLVAPEIGIVQNIENDSLLHSFGFRYLVESAQKLLSPRNVSDEQFLLRLSTRKKSKVPLYACNLFIPGDLKVVGPKVDEQAVLVYVEIVFKRAKEAGLKMLIWGSGGSRGIPAGFDRNKAQEQFISIAKKIARVAAKYKILLAFESLNKTECNFINTIPEALVISKAVGHKNFRLCIDIYHMLKEGELPNAVRGTKNYVVYCEVAEKDGRTPPGVQGDDLIPYFVALKNENYKGKIIIECRWHDLATQGVASFIELRRQVDEAYK